MRLDVAITKQIGTFHSQITCNVTHHRCGIFGPSGSGKSTITNLLAGLLKPDTGFIRLNGLTLFDADEKINLSPDKRRVGVVFQQAHLFPHLAVRNNLYYGFNRTPPSQKFIAPERVVGMLGLEPFLDRPVTQLSGGERQRVALGRAILACPHLIILDEPLSGLDGSLKYRIIPHLNAVLEEFSIPMLFISHSLEEMRLMTDEVLVVENGKIREGLATEELCRKNMGKAGTSYTNLLKLSSPKHNGDLLTYRWGDIPLSLVPDNRLESGRFGLDAKEIVLFKKHPEATSARNLLTCDVTSIFHVNNRVGVELDCRGNTLVAQIVPQSIRELDLSIGSQVTAVIKASAFERLY